MLEMVVFSLKRFILLGVSLWHGQAVGRENPSHLCQHNLDAKSSTEINSQREEVAIAISAHNNEVLRSSTYDYATDLFHVHNSKRIKRRVASEGGSTTSIQSTIGVGDYIISGLGAVSQSGSSTGIPISSASGTSNSTSMMPVRTSSVTLLHPSMNDTSSVSGSSRSQTVSPSLTSSKTNILKGISRSPSLFSNATSTAIVSPIPSMQFNSSSQYVSAVTSVRNSSFTYGFNGNGSVESCWNQWQSYWSFYDLRSASIYGSPPISTSTSTVTETWTYTYTFDDPSGIITETDVGIETDDADGFIISTLTSTYFTTTYTLSGNWETTTTSTDSGIDIEDKTSWVFSSAPTDLITPGCTLPTYVPQCQSQWESYKSVQAASPYAFYPFGAPHPACSQATTQPGQCASLQSQYIATWSYGEATALNQGGDIITIGNDETSVTLVNGTSTTYERSSWWPTHSTLFPGCTVGCMSCAITGGKVQLIYWPEGTSMTPNISVTSQPSHPVSAIPKDITPSLDQSFVQSVVRIATGFGTTFTSPTVYISYAKIYASDSCSGIGSTYYNTIVPVTHSADISSIWASYVDDDIVGPSTAFFNYTDLNSPVSLVYHFIDPLSVTNIIGSRQRF